MLAKSGLAKCGRGPIYLDSPSSPFGAPPFRAPFRGPTTSANRLRPAGRNRIPKSKPAEVEIDFHNNTTAKINNKKVAFNCNLTLIVIIIIKIIILITGLHTTAREPKRAHLSFPAFKNTTKIPRENHQERDKQAKMGAGEGRKSEMLGDPVEVIQRRGPAQGRSGAGSRTGLNQQQTTTTTTTHNHNTRNKPQQHQQQQHTNGLAKKGLAQHWPKPLTTNH